MFMSLCQVQAGSKLISACSSVLIFPKCAPTSSLKSWMLIPQLTTMTATMSLWAMTLLGPAFRTWHIGNKFLIAKNSKLTITDHRNKTVTTTDNLILLCGT